MKRILVLAPHTDDAELGCGGTLAKYVQQGSEVLVVAFSCGTSNAKEFYESCHVLGVERKLYNFETRNFTGSRQEILNTLIGIRATYNPDTVFIPSSDDIHQDHRVIHDEAVRAFKHARILGMELPWNNFSFKNQCYSFISSEHLALKINALKHYESQKSRNYFSADFIRSLAVVRGVQAGESFAECFEVVREFI